MTAQRVRQVASGPAAIASYIGIVLASAVIAYTERRTSVVREESREAVVIAQDVAQEAVVVAQETAATNTAAQSNWNRKMQAQIDEILRAQAVQNQRFEGRISWVEGAANVPWRHKQEEAE